MVHASASELPADTTTTRPTSVRRLMRVSHTAAYWPPRDKLTTATLLVLVPSALIFAHVSSTHCRPLVMVEVPSVCLPDLAFTPRTLPAWSLQPGATPCCSPAMMPATWVPWPSSSVWEGLPLNALYTSPTWPLNSSWLTFRPESRTKQCTPVPSRRFLSAFGSTLKPSSVLSMRDSPQFQSSIPRGACSVEYIDNTQWGTSQ
mmetsp:Transcript_20621/g.57234  ORF Transcript_20621/g.57234 Transcript_20621/m.57234 type:complete len:203 (+) Transcript_20621:1843-2451(+)